MRKVYEYMEAAMKPISMHVNHSIFNRIHVVKMFPKVLFIYCFCIYRFFVCKNDECWKRLRILLRFLKLTFGSFLDFGKRWKFFKNGVVFLPCYFCISAKDFLLDVVVTEAGLTRKRGGVCFWFYVWFFVNVGVFLFLFLNNKNIECSAQNPPTNQRWPFPTVLNFCCFLQSTSTKNCKNKCLQWFQWPEVR